ncbi:MULTISPECIES: hypothetical protein [Devosia]|uniref:hypothetical protein n=1 Tax=Devosia TaxID=46913 RepID=UPI000CE979FF|nr:MULTISPECIES: hypothetical protein [Devosia]AVF02918.1 hypothetical protein C4375_03655 [Devosia sp. I507]
MAEPTLAQMYNGIYSTYDPSIPPIAPQQPALATPVVLPPAIQRMYEGVYGPATEAWAAQRNQPATAPPVALAPSASIGITTDLGGMSWGALANMFPSSRAQTETVQTAAPGVTEYGIDKGLQERLLPNPMGSMFDNGVGQPPATRRVPSVPINPQQASVPMPRERPAGSILSRLFTMPTPASQRPPSIDPLRVAVNGANSYRAPVQAASSGGGSGGGSSSAPSFSGTSSGRSYTPGQQYQMGNDTYTANADGGFTNDRTGRAQGTGTVYYDTDANTFRRR